MERLVASLSGARWFGLVGRWLLTPLDRVLRRSRWAPSRIGTDLPLCFVTSNGRRSGEPRTAPLVYLAADGGGIVVVGTNWGGRRHPGWSYNLDADPRTFYEIDGSVTPAMARRTTAVEFAAYWEGFVGRWPNYARYRDRLTREVRMYVLEPVEELS